jgi:hypothetical protein
LQPNDATAYAGAERFLTCFGNTDSTQAPKHGFLILFFITFLRDLGLVAPIAPQSRILASAKDKGDRLLPVLVIAIQSLCKPPASLSQASCKSLSGSFQTFYKPFLQAL